MNYQITEVMEEFDQDTDQMLFYLPITGSTFKKVYFDPTRQRAVSKFVPAEDLIVPYLHLICVQRSVTRMLFV